MLLNVVVCLHLVEREWVVLPPSVVRVFYVAVRVQIRRLSINDVLQRRLASLFISLHSIRFKEFKHLLLCHELSYFAHLMYRRDLLSQLSLDL